MELWIRSQDKYTLEKITEVIQICENPDGTWFFNTGYILGKYKTKERALEVLDEIQEILCPKQPKAIVGKNVEFIPLDIYVYEMPKE